MYIDGPTDESKLAVGMATIGEAFCGGPKRDETIYIRKEFLKRHNIQIPESDNKIKYFW